MNFPKSHPLFRNLPQPVCRHILLLILAFLLGNAAAMLRDCFLPDTGSSTSASAASDASASPGEMDISGAAASASSSSARIRSAAEGSWGLSFPEDGKPPVANATFSELAKFNAFYAEDTDKKRIYLTFDAGYENGNTAPILDALKQHQAPATFFVTGAFISENPELIKRMTAEGHIVGNHTYSHPDMSQISEKEAFQEELTRVSDIYKEITGTEMTKFYRPPQGKYSEANLTMAQDLGYHTFFWSLAYVDWYQDDQPTREEAFEKLLGRIHPGAIVLLHSTSSTNGEILDELLEKWEEMGYHFKSLKHLVNL